MPSKRLNADSQTELTGVRSTELTPPTYDQVNAILDERVNELPSGDWTNASANEFRHFTIDVQMEASARSVACRQQFARSCQNCKMETVNDRAACAKLCGCIVCSRCAESAQNCPNCAKSTAYLRLFEEASRECLVCTEMPFGRAAFVPCGHIVCTACVARMTLDITTEGICCPFCRAHVVNVVHLEETVISPSIDTVSN